MERLSEYAYEPMAEMRAEKQSNYERQFERNLGFSIEETERIRLMPGVQKVERSPEMGRVGEAMWHRDTQTLVVPPPQGVEGVEALAQMAVPVVGYIDLTKPDIIIGCDRGGRLFSVATHSMWKATHKPDRRFPTIDEKLRFAHFSRRFGPEVFAHLLEDTLERTASEARHDIHGEKPHILFIDDHVSTGATRRFAREGMNLIGLGEDQADMSFAISWGTEADVSGGSASIEEPWQNKPKLIGVDYDENHVGYVVRSEEARKIRADLHKAVTKEAFNGKKRLQRTTIASMAMASAVVKQS